MGDKIENGRQYEFDKLIDNAVCNRCGKPLLFELKIFITETVFPEFVAECCERYRLTPYVCFVNIDGL